MLEDLRSLREEAQAAIQSWWDTYADDPTGENAQEALQELGQEQQGKLEALLETYGVDLSSAAATGGGGLPRWW